MRYTLSLVFAVAVAVALPFGAAQALMLDTWNNDELQASDDYVDLQFGAFGGNTTLTLQWIGGADDTSGALGIDMLFINNTNSALEVVSVYVNSIVAANDITSDWMPTNGGTGAGGGFGVFVEKTADSGGTDGIAPETLIFVLNGLYPEASFTPNADGASFAAHLRYGNECSGWVADGGTAGNDGSDSNCGGAPVPEPSAALAFAAGALVVGSALRRRR